jgi:hypothetical protein
MSTEGDSDKKAVEAALENVEKAEEGVDEARQVLVGAEGRLEHAVEELKAAEHGHKDDLVAIVVDGVDRRVRAGKWLVRDLKAALEIDPAKVLAEITPHDGLKDLNDDADIEIREGLKFMTHGRSGGSS